MKICLGNGSYSVYWMNLVERTALQNVYASIAEKFCEIEEEDLKLMNPRLFEIDPKFGNRSIYQPTVRGCLSAYRKRGLVERTGEGIYRLTNEGKKRLRESLRGAKPLFI